MRMRTNDLDRWTRRGVVWKFGVLAIGGALLVVDLVVDVIRVRHAAGTSLADSSVWLHELAWHAAPTALLTGYAVGRLAWWAIPRTSPPAAG